MKTINQIQLYSKTLLSKIGSMVYNEYSISKYKGENMTARLTKKQKVLNLLSKGNNVAWTTIRSRFDLTSPRAMVDTLRSEGHVIYTNTVGGKTFYRLGAPSAAIIQAGIDAVLGTEQAYAS
jgi:hypothetical protein|tara:strand:+ start:273 stop:638 length:366 start_codon:yes stop_codon:yes gene_type:complete